ncbi:endoribonuclease L-PSP [Colletotrichum camelliae]|nr:endoribonuclease L-PSP [Colletotrichum camelliae]
MPEFIPQTPASASGVRFFNWPGAGEEISETLKMTHACVIPPGASIIHVGGQAGIKGDGTVPADLTEEIREAFSHIELSLREAGLTGSSEEVWACVYKVMYLGTVRTYHANTDAGFGLTLHGVLMEYFGKNRPLFTGVDVFKLLRPELHLEIEVEAFLPNTQA